MAKETFYLNAEETHNSSSMDGQVPHIRLNAQIEAYSFSNIPFKFVAVNLKGSSVAASKHGVMAFNRLDLRGWFTDEIFVEMHLTDARATIQQDSPTTVVGSGVTSSSTGIAINESLGTFGPIPTTGTSIGFSIGSSFSANVQDFLIINNSSNREVKHTYRIAASSGGPFNQIEDLLDTSPYGQFRGAPLFELPPLAISNLPLLSQAIFLVPPEVGNTSLVIQITHHLLKIEKTFQLVTVHLDQGSETWEGKWSQPLPLSKLNEKPDPAA